jgi:SHS2 domain-containing protein
MATRRFETRDHTADIYILGYGETLAEAFENVAFALFEQIADTARLRPQRTLTVQAEGSDVEALLVNWLNEFLYLHEAQEVAFCDVHVETLETGPPARVRAQAEATPWDAVPEEAWRMSVKAATYHALTIRQRVDGVWEAGLVCDV